MPAIWTAPKSWSVGEIVTAAALNTHVRDNFEYLKSRDDATLNHAAFASGVSYNTTSTSFVDVDAALVLNLTTRGAPVLFGVTGSWKSTIAAAECCLDLAVDGARIGDATYGMVLVNAPVANGYTHFSMIGVRAATASAHVFRPKWRTSSGTLSAAIYLNFFVLELL